MPVSPDDPGSLRVLIVEDDAEMGELLRRCFVDNPDYAATVAIESTLAAAKAALETIEVDAILLDLGLPDSGGLRTAKMIVEAAPPSAAVVILTGLRDQSLAAQSLAIGVQDYVVKEDLTPALVTRVVRYAVTRAQMSEQLAQARRGEERERELRRLERLATEGAVMSVSATMLGAGGIAERMGSRYDDEIVSEYRRILSVSLEEQAFRGSSQVAADLRSLASVLGFFGAGPRDIVELHSRCLRLQVGDLDRIRATAAVEEGRVLVLQLMGRLVTYYRDRSLGSSRHGARSTASSSTSGPTRPDSKDVQ